MKVWQFEFSNGLVSMVAAETREDALIQAIILGRADKLVPKVNSFKILRD